MAGTEKMAMHCKQEKDMDMDNMDKQTIAVLSAKRSKAFMTATSSLFASCCSGSPAA